jgi:hypothetical protein
MVQQSRGFLRRGSGWKALEVSLADAALPIRAILVEQLALSAINHF